MKSMFNSSSVSGVAMALFMSIFSLFGIAPLVSAAMSSLLGIVHSGSKVGYPATAAARFSDWSAPVNLGPVVNSAFLEFGPAYRRTG